MLRNKDKNLLLGSISLFYSQLIPPPPPLPQGKCGLQWVHNTMLCGCLLNSSLCFSVCPLHGLQLMAGEPANVGSLQQQSLSGHIYLLQHRVLHRLLWHGSLQVNICSTVPPALLLFLYLLFSGLTLSPPIPTPHSAAFTTLHCFYNSFTPLSYPVQTLCYILQMLLKVITDLAKFNTSSSEGVQGN